MASGAAARPSRRWRRVALAVLALFVLLFVVAAVRFAPLFLGPSYAGVTSIETRRDYRDPPLMAAAWALPVAARYRQSRFEYQANPSFCGPTSLADLLHSLGRGDSQTAVIAGTPHAPWFGYLIPGMTLDALADLARIRLGRSVTIVRDPSLAEFRRHMALSNDPGRRYIVNFHRGPLFGRGGGHFSPILGYLADRDLVLVGDVNAKYRPFLVSSERLWRATDTLDSETGKERGLIAVTVGAPPRTANSSVIPSLTRDPASLAGKHKQLGPGSSPG